MAEPSWNLQVILFAGARQLTGLDTVQVTVAAHADAAGVLRALIVRHPELTELASVSRLAMNCRYLADHDPVDPTGELALIPPVSGG